MATFQKDIQAKIDADKRNFVRELEAVSPSLAVWAQQQMINDEWSISDVKVALKVAMAVCDRD